MEAARLVPLAVIVVGLVILAGKLGKYSTNWTTDADLHDYGYGRLDEPVHPRRFRDD